MSIFISISHVYNVIIPCARLNLKMKETKIPFKESLLHNEKSVPFICFHHLIIVFGILFCIQNKNKPHRRKDSKANTFVLVQKQKVNKIDSNKKESAQNFMYIKQKMTNVEEVEMNSTENKNKTKKSIEINFYNENKKKNFNGDSHT